MNITKMVLPPAVHFLRHGSNTVVIYYSHGAHQIIGKKPSPVIIMAWNDGL